MANETTYQAFRIAFDGRAYHGYQRQPDQPTVEAALFRALQSLEVSTSQYTFAGRTDAGVSALAQTISIECPEWLTPAALNGALPDEIAAWAYAEVPADFHARYDAIEREYVYVHYAPTINLTDVRDAGDSLVGTHDFRHLTADREHTVRTISSIDVERSGGFVYITVRAPGFLRHQVRRIVSLLDEVGRGNRSLHETEEILTGKPLPGHAGVPPADPRFLVLTDVRYRDVSFVREEDVTAQVRERFHDTAVQLESIARLMGRIAEGIG